MTGISMLNVGKPFVGGIDNNAVAIRVGAIAAFFHKIIRGFFAKEGDIVIGRQLQCCLTAEGNGFWPHFCLCHQCKKFGIAVILRLCRCDECEAGQRGQQGMQDFFHKCFLENGVEEPQVAAATV